MHNITENGISPVDYSISKMYFTETLQFRPQPFGTVCRQLWDCLPAQFRHLRRNWKLSMPARRRSASEVHFLRFTNVVVILIIIIIIT